ncbi:MAG: peptidoglycan DD-metalloendopeptidase family protein [Bacteroidales bacterium]|nr:peptidoglycan DD-metalloendopeptidase family protein [Clostridium sp.]MCM1203637.1 peptidoglycan DD-metalloendopeptidase family protein [Bacteroidales bacterium]
MNRGIAWAIGGAMLFLLLFSVILGAEYTESENNGYYYGTNEWMWVVPDCRKISSYFGKRKSPAAGASADHKGIDIPCAEGTNVVASKSGTVTVAESSSSEGNWIAVQHDEHFTSYYMHNSTLLVKAGDTVAKGQVIALSGNTGISTGAHCHFAILKDGKYVNPLDYVDKDEEIRYTTTASTGLRNDMVAYAKQFIGNPYVYGGTSLTSGADCSGYTMRIYEHFGITIPRTAQAQYNASEKINREDLLPGDLLFYGGSINNVSHVTMYIGNNQVIHASNSKPYPEGGIKISDIGYRQPCGYGRFIQASYSEEDLRYMAACIAAEALSSSKEGQYAVGYVVANRVNAKGFGKTVKEVVTAPGQFTSPWNQYVNNPPSWALESARAVLEGTATNPIGGKCYFISSAYAKKLGIETKGVNVGDNVFYDECLW